MNRLLKITFVLLLVLFGANSSFSQTLVWEKLAGNNNKEERCAASAPLGKSRYLFGGYEFTLSLNKRIPLLVFTNLSGDTVLTRRYPQINDGEINGITTDKDSSILAAGNFTNAALNQGRVFVFKANHSGTILWQKEFNPGLFGDRIQTLIIPDGYLISTGGGATLLKLDKQGNLVWQKALALGYVTGGSISLMQDGSYLLCGTTDVGSSTALGGYYRANPFIAKIKPNGDTIRTKILGSFQHHDMAHEARQTSDGGVIIVGRYVINSHPTIMQGLLIKLDSALNQQWWYTIMPPHGDYDKGCELFNVQQLADSSYIVSGNYVGNYSTGVPDDNGYVAKIAKDGSANTWQQEYGNFHSEYFSSMFYKSDGSAVFSGTKNLYPNFDFYLVKLKNLGLPYVPDYCQQKPTPQLSVQVIAGDSIAFTSTSVPGTRYGTISTYTWHFGDGNSSTKAAPKHKYNMPLAQLQNVPVTLIVTNNSGCTDSITTYPFLRVSASGAMPALQVQVYPNPASAKAIFSISGYSGKEPLTVELLDVLGRKLQVQVKQQQAGEMQQQEVNTAALPAGLYLYRLYSGSKLLGTGKLVKE